MNKKVLKEQVLAFIQAALVTAERNGMDIRQTAETILDALEAEPARTHIELHLQVIDTETMIEKLKTIKLPDDWQPEWEKAPNPEWEQDWDADDDDLDGEEEME